MTHHPLDGTQAHTVPSPPGGLQAIARASAGDTFLGRAPASAREESALVSKPDNNAAVKEPGSAGKATSKQFKDLRGLVEYAYSRRGQRVVLKKAAAASLAQDTEPFEAIEQRIRELSLGDVLLAVPKEILLATLPHRKVSNTWARIERVVAIALDCYAPTTGLASQVLGTSKDGSELRSLLEAAASRDYGSAGRVEGAKPLTKSQLALARMNAVYTVGIWAFARADVDLDTVVRNVHEVLWEPEADRVASDAESLRLMSELRQSAAAGLIGNAFAGEVRRQAAVADAAERAESQARVTAAQLEDRVEALGREVADRDRIIAALRSELHEAIETGKNQKIHLKDDYEQLRTRVLRRLKREVDLLEEGLLALRRDPPKVHVMDDHADRAVAGLRAEMKELQGEEHP